MLLYIRTMAICFISWTLKDQVGSWVKSLHAVLSLVCTVLSHFDWKLIVVLPVYMGKSDPMDCGSYRGMKSLEHAMKVVERVFKQELDSR